MTKPYIANILKRAKDIKYNSGEEFRQVRLEVGSCITLCECLIEAEKALQFYTDPCFNPLDSKAKEALASLRSRIEFGSGE